MKRLLIVILGAAIPLMAEAQITPGWAGCIDPKNTTPFSTPFGVANIGDSLFSATLGVVGTVTYGGSTGPCFGPSAVTANVRGRIGFQIGTVGSIQSTSDDGMYLTFGMPYPGADWSYAETIEDGKQTLFGANAFLTEFTGASDRYIFAETTNGDDQISLRIDVVGDTSRLQWTLTNTSTASHTFGLWFGQRIGELTQNQQSSSGTSISFGQAQSPGFIAVPGIKPPTTEKRFTRNLAPATYPPYVDFDFDQNNAYGLRVLTGPTAETEDSSGLASTSDATQSDEFALGQSFFLLGAPTSGGDPAAFPDVMFGPNNTGGDVNIIGDQGYILKYNDTDTAGTVPAGASRTIVSYFRGTWGQANYFEPYSVVLDAPQVIGNDLTDPSGLSQPNGGYDFRVWLDNTRGFTTVDKTIELDNVKVTINLPPGLNLAAGDTATKIIPRIPAGGGTDLPFVDFHVIPDGVAFGNLPYTITVSPTPGPTKTINGTVEVAATPKLTLNQGANLVSTPFTFNDSSWEQILGLTQGAQFQAFNWDPAQNGYVQSGSAQRGIGTWIIANNQYGIVKLQSQPTVPTDLQTGAQNIGLHPGWNLIANPYNYAVPIGQLVGVSQAAPNQSYSWDELVQQGLITGVLAYQPAGGTGYSYIQSDTDLISPNVGYWIFVPGNSDFTLNFPPVFTEYLPTRSAPTNTWTQTANNWHLQLAARMNNAIDDHNYVGVVASTKQVQALQIPKPPTPPAQVATVQMAIDAPVNGKTTRLAQALATSVQQQYSVTVTTNQAGNVTLTWPNMPTVPKNVQFRLIDTATGATRLLRQSSGYTFLAAANTTRTFTLQIQSGTVSAPVIGNVVVTRPSRDRTAPFTIAYTLSGASMTSVRILSASGREVATVTSGRADQAGTNTVVWNMKDNANRSVAPGTYQVEIIAQTQTGDQVRRVVTLNVVR